MATHTTTRPSRIGVHTYNGDAYCEFLVTLDKIRIIPSCSLCLGTFCREVQQEHLAERSVGQFFLSHFAMKWCCVLVWSCVSPNVCVSLCLCPLSPYGSSVRVDKACDVGFQGRQLVHEGLLVHVDVHAVVHHLETLEGYC